MSVPPATTVTASPSRPAATAPVQQQAPPPAPSTQAVQQRTQPPAAAPTQVAQQQAEAPAPEVAQTQPPAAPAQPAQTQPPADPAPAGVSFGSCAEARAAGAAPLYRGQPGYSSSLDRDHDGVACE
ncbi:hypothetical protein ACG83_23255 [Frankia sp. R43]|nr:hypothetical protein ACG83_23255 [Frankia sp. R43]